MHTSRRGEGRECGQLCYGPSRLRAVRGYYPYLRCYPPFTHTSVWRWLSRTLPSTRSALASRRTGSRTAAGRSTCEQKGERSGACESPALLCNLASRGLWVLAPYFTKAAGATHKENSRFSLLLIVTELIWPHTIACAISPELRTQGRGGGARGTVGRRGAARGGGGRHGAA